jgi:hypothetical protein
MIYKMPAIEKGKAANSGYYQVGNQIFNNKVAALYAASKANKIPEFHLHDDIFSAVPWTLPSTRSLEAVYKERAQEIRDNYDYVSLSFSGGADSWNALYAFLSNGIHLDEVYSKWAIEGPRKYIKANNIITDASNFTSEYEYSVKPVLEYIEKNFPKIKITFQELTDEYFDIVTEDQIIRSGVGAFQGLSPIRCAHSIGLDVDYTTKKVASVRGGGKLQIYLENKKFYTYFSDAEAWPVDADPHFTLEHFYLGINCGELLRVQAHAVMNFFKANPHLQYIIERKVRETSPGVFETVAYRNVNEEAQRVYDNIIKSVCYPKWDPKTFQANKNTTALFEREEDFWILKDNPTSVQSWRWCLEQYLKDINPIAFKQVEGNKRAMKNIISKPYLVGSI